MATMTSAPAAKDAGGKPDAGEKAPRSKKKLIIVVLVLLLVGAGGYLKFVKAAPAEAAPKPGTVLKLEPITLNLAEGHYLKLTLALQFTAAASAAAEHGDKPDGSRALDAAIAQLSNRKIVELNSAGARAKVKADLMKEIGEAYEHKVMDVYFTEFVMQ